MPKVKLDDINVFYTISGEGDPLILLHGNCDSQKDFNYVYSELTKRFKVYAIDSRFQGKTSKGKTALTYPVMAKDLYNFIQHFKIIKPSILGFSDGGIIGLEYAARWPENMGKLVTMGANWTVEGISQSALAWINTIRKRIKPFKFIPTLGRIHTVSGIMVRPECYSTEDLLQKICTPVLIMAGDRDMISQEHTDWLCEKVHGSEKKIFPDTSHFIMKERPKEFLNTIFAWI